MRIQIAARHCEIPDAIRARAEAYLQKMLRYEPRLSAAELVFDMQAHLKQVEAVISVDREEPLVARAEGVEFRDAVDKLADRLRRRLRRRREQRRERQVPRPSQAS
ncbi:MAG: ribosome-associated translation inhibitor RaiA [Gemmatimonadetes bacterium]|nr:ribosome-associated translation inhibitor RaiA [Gemmatimonadota bacterium]